MYSKIPPETVALVKSYDKTWSFWFLKVICSSYGSKLLPEYKTLTIKSPVDGILFSKSPPTVVKYIPLIVLIPVSSEDMFVSGFLLKTLNPVLPWTPVTSLGVGE